MQCIHTIDGYAIPLTIKNGLPYMQVHLYTNMEWEELPDVVLRSDVSWDPAVYDSVLTDDDSWYDDVADFTNDDYSWCFWSMWLFQAWCSKQSILQTKWS